MRFLIFRVMGFWAAGHVDDKVCEDFAPKTPKRETRVREDPLDIGDTQWYGHIGNSMMKSMRCLSDIEETHYFIRSADNSALVIYLVTQYINTTNWLL